MRSALRPCLVRRKKCRLEGREWLACDGRPARGANARAIPWLMVFCRVMHMAGYDVIGRFDDRGRRTTTFHLIVITATISGRGP